MKYGQREYKDCDITDENKSPLKWTKGDNSVRLRGKEAELLHSWFWLLGGNNSLDI